MGEVLAFRSRRSVAKDLGRPGRSGVSALPNPPAAGTRQPDAAGCNGDPGRRGVNSGTGTRPDRDQKTRPRYRDPLWREVTGAVLRDERHRQRRTLAQVAGRAGMSAQYLSQLERGQKEASSEMLAAACGSLGMGMAEFAVRCARFVAAASSRPSGPVLLAA